MVPPASAQQQPNASPSSGTLPQHPQSRRILTSQSANITIGDLSDGTALVSELRTLTSNPNHHYIPLDVTSWSSQTTFFQTALTLSPTKTLHHILANAGLGEQKHIITALGALSPEFPPAPPQEPQLSTLNVNLIGAIYTARLALHYLRLTPEAEKPSILFTGSMACFLDGSPVMAMYGASKHGLLGFFRSLRHEDNAHNIRVNLMCPYFIDTPIIPPVGKMLLAGIEKVEVWEVVEAAERLLCEEKGGRCMIVAPKGTGGIQEMDAMSERALEEFSNRIINLMSIEGRVKKLGRWTRDLRKLFGVWVIVGAVGGMVGGLVATVVAVRKVTGV